MTLGVFQKPVTPVDEDLFPLKESGDHTEQ